MSRYSAEMKDDLLKWCGVVEKAERFAQVLKATQELWLYLNIYGSPGQTSLEL